MKKVLKIGIMSRKEYVARTIALAKGFYVPRSASRRSGSSRRSPAEVLSNDNT